MNSYDLKPVEQLPAYPDDLYPWLEAAADAEDTAGALARFVLDPVSAPRREYMGARAVVDAANNLSLKLIFPKLRDHVERENELKHAGAQTNRLHQDLRFLLAGLYFSTTRELNAWRGHRIGDQNARCQSR